MKMLLLIHFYSRTNFYWFNQLFSCQTWKNETVAEQDKRSVKERPILLSKDIESKLALLDREVNYLLNKAKFAKPKSKAKAKDGASSEKNDKSNTTAEEKVLPPTQEGVEKENSGSNTLHLLFHLTNWHHAQITFFFLLSWGKPRGSEARSSPAWGRECCPHRLRKPVRAYGKRSNYRSVR